jgi:hypothetical protein
MAERVALWGRDIDESSADLDDGYVAPGQHEPITEPVAMVDGGDEPIGDVEAGPDSLHVRPAIDRRLGSASSTLTFKPAPTPWYRTGRGLVVLMGAIGVVVVLSVVPMLLRDSAPGLDEPTDAPPTTAVPAPSSVRPPSDSAVPTLTSRPAPSPPPAPPPPPPAQETPVYVPRYQAPSSEAAKPEIDVTRAPISVAPKPVTPIDPPRTGGGGNDNRRGFGW